MNEVLRQEKKYFLNMQDFYRISAQLSPLMLQDAHNGALGYQIRSLYFDTPYDEDFYDKENGLELRRKIRLRIYDPNNDFAMLEIKQKQGALQKKRSLRVTREDAKKLIQCDYEPLLAYEDAFAAECYGLMKMKCYRPKTVVEYKRKAFIAKENRIRITLDSELTATESCFDIFNSHLPMYSVLPSYHSVLEVKFNGFLLSYIKDLLNLADRSPLSVSKYCMARSVSLKYTL